LCHVLHCTLTKIHIACPGKQNYPRVVSLLIIGKAASTGYVWPGIMLASASASVSYVVIRMFGP